MCGMCKTLIELRTRSVSSLGALWADGFETVGPAIAPADLVQLSMPSARVHDGWLETGVAFIDSFGNARLAGRPDDLAAAVGPLDGGRRLILEVAAGEPDTAASGIVAGRVEVTWQRTFGRVAVGESLLYEDSFGTLSAADNQGNIAARLGLAVDQPVRIRAA
jgi:S-adenosylmethionine hydrolase